jgi:hypothetical protein
MISKTCLKCGKTSEVSEDPIAECPACGAIYSRVEEAHQKRQQLLPPPAAESSIRNSNSAKWLIVVGLGFVSLIVFSIWQLLSTYERISHERMEHADQVHAGNSSSSNTPTAATTPQAERATALESKSEPQTGKGPAAEPQNHHDAWTYEADADPMVTNGIKRTGLIESRNTVEFGFPYSGAQRAGLVVRIVSGSDPEVIFILSRGQLECSGLESCSIGVKFDDAEAEQFSAGEAADHSSQILFLHDADRFMSRLENSHIVRIQPVVYQNGSPVFEFKADGYSSATLRATMPRVQP